jgi:pilus assembly protein Flp/PilA
MAYLISKATAYLTAFRKNEEGVTAIEYGLIAGAIAVAIIAVLLTMGSDIANMFSSVSSALQQAAGS